MVALVTDGTIGGIAWPARPRSLELSHVKPALADFDGLSRILARDSLIIRSSNGDEVPLPAELAEAIAVMADELANGHEVTVLARESLLSPADVAEMLGLSRAFVVRLMDTGKLAFRHLPDSTHRLVRLDDVVRFREQRERKAEAHRRITEAAEEMGLPY